MAFFINSGVFAHEACKIARSKEGNGSFVLTVPNYVLTTNAHEEIKFIFHGYTGNNLLEYKRDWTFKGPTVLLQTTDSTEYFVDFTEDPKDNLSMYALLRSDDAFPDDIFIPSNMKDKVEVLRRLRFKDSEPDLAGFLSNVYLVKISLSSGESIPIHFSAINSANTGKYRIITNTENTYKISNEIDISLLEHKDNLRNLISLSECIGFDNKDVSNVLSDKQKIVLTAMYLCDVHSFIYTKYCFSLLDKDGEFIKMFNFSKDDDEFNLRILDNYLIEQHTYNMEDIIKSFCPEYAYLIK